jgi:sphingosine kinase
MISLCCLVVLASWLTGSAGAAQLTSWQLGLIVAPLLLRAVLALRDHRWWQQQGNRAQAYVAPAGKTAADQWCKLAGKHVLVLLNPHGGAKSAQLIYDRVLLPMSLTANVSLQLVCTERAGHAREVVAALGGAGVTDSSSEKTIGAVVCISGDGMLHEVVGAMMAKPESQRIPLAILPGGTSNGVCMCLVGSADPYLAGKAFLEGGPRKVDLFSTCDVSAGARKGSSSSSSSSSEAVFDAHVLSWGVVAQNDHLAERTLRWIEPKSIKEWVCAATVIATRRTWFGRIAFLPCPDAPVSESGTKSPQYYDLPDVSLALPAGQPSCSLQGDEAVAWRVIDGPVRFCCVVNMAWASHDVQFCPGLCPDAGYFDLLIARTPSRWQLLTGFLAMDVGGHVSQPSFERYRCKAVEITSRKAAASDSAEDVLDLDISGEQYAMGTARVECLPRAGLFWY